MGLCRRFGIWRAVSGVSAVVACFGAMCARTEARHEAAQAGQSGEADHITAKWTGHYEAVMPRHDFVAHDERMAEAGAAVAKVLPSVS